MHDPEVQSQTLDGASDHEEETKSSLYLFLLVLSLGGLQIVWSVELSNGSPYLLSLGMSKVSSSFCTRSSVARCLELR